jgi:hypothetical protein
MISSRLDGTIVGRLCQTPIHRTGVWQNGAAGDASDMDGQAGRLSEREQASQTPYNAFGLSQFKCSAVYDLTVASKRLPALSKANPTG